MITCIAVDDEPLALDIIDVYCQKVETLELIGKFTSSLDALKFLKDNNVDLIFLDIQMPQVDGMEFVTLLTNKPYIVFTTAYNDFALQSYDYKTVDYLLKPFSFARFIKSIEKVTSLIKSDNESKLNILHKSDASDYIFVQSSGKTIKLFLRDIIYIKGMSDYIVLYTSNNKKVIAKDSLRQVAEMLQIRGFIRVHKSYIVSIEKIDVVDGNVIKMGEIEIPVGKNYKDDLNFVLKSNRIG